MTLDEQLAARADAAFNQRLHELFSTFREDLDFALAIPFSSTGFNSHQAVERFRKTPEVVAAVETKRAEHRELFVKELLDRLQNAKGGAA